MMKSKLILVLLTSFLTTSAAWAKYYVFPLSKDSTPENPQIFYCEAKKIEDIYPADTIYMTNFAQMVSGFGQDGNLEIRAPLFNEVYFKAYHDNSLPSPLKDEPGYVVMIGGTFDFQCFDVKVESDIKDRKLISKSFG